MQKLKRLYLDDLRTPVDNEWIVVRSFKEAKIYVLTNGVPDVISFDHDLGIDNKGNLLPSGYDFARWLVAADMSGTIHIPSTFKYKIHSQNPIGAKNIKGLLENYLKFKDLDK